MPASTPSATARKRDAESQGLHIVAPRRRSSKRVRAEDIELAFIQCRSLGHSWRHRPEPYDEQSDGFARPLAAYYHTVGLISVCSNCTTTRIKWIGSSGALVGSNSYRYPDGYQTHGEERRMPLDWRRAFVVRVFGDV